MTVDPNEAPNGYIAVKWHKDCGDCGKCALNHACVISKCDRSTRHDGEDVYFVKKPVETQKPTCDGRAIVAMMCRVIRLKRSRVKLALDWGDEYLASRIMTEVFLMEDLKDHAKAMLK